MRAEVQKGIGGSEGDTQFTPQIKICGLTLTEEAVACAAAGADAIGLVFYPPSKRYVTAAQARAISDALPAHVPTVGVFVDPSWDDLVHAVKSCNLGGLQLHGQESPEFVTRVGRHFGLPLLKGLYVTRSPWLSEAESFAATAYLVECGHGAMPGGNAIAWDWGAAREFAQRHPTVLAGGLTSDNVVQAIVDCLPDAVDASSGLESGPGRKDIAKVKHFIDQVRATSRWYRSACKPPKPIFSVGG